MLHVVPESRISAEEALTHSYFKGFSVEELINIPISEQMMNYNSKSKNSWKRFQRQFCNVGKSFQR